MTTTTAPQKTGATLSFIENRSRRTVYFGPAELNATFGVTVPVPVVPALFSETVVERALQLNCSFVQQSTTGHEKPLTLQYLHGFRENKDALGGTFLCNIVWYQEEPLFVKHTPRPGLFMKGRSVIAESTGKTFVGESLVAANFVEELFGEELPESYGVAIKELRTGAERLEKLCHSDWQEGGRQCVALAFSRLFREPPIEVLYRVLLEQKINRERLFERIYTRTNNLSANGYVVNVGDADAHGAGLYYGRPGHANVHLGFSFSCSGALEPAR